MKDGKADPSVPGMSLTMQAAKKIDELIYSGRLVAGQRLIEVDLCEQLQIGRVPVREALRIMAGDGVIELIPGRGARVRELSPRQIADMLKVITGLLFVALDDVGQRLGEADIKAGLRLQQKVIEKAQAAKDPFAISDAMCAYQDYLVSCSSNDYLKRMMSNVHFYFYARQVLRYVGLTEIYAASANYTQITKALISADMEKAKTLFCQTGGRMMTLLSDMRP